MNRDERELTELLAALGRVVDHSPVAGGCISQAARVRLRDQQGEQRTVFVKQNDASFVENFDGEADGLRRLAAAGAIAVPQPLRVAAIGRHAYIVTTWIEAEPLQSGVGSEAFFACFGRQLAELHHRTRGEQIGLDRDNFLGAARQINTPTASWTEFVQTHRIGFQLRWAVDQRLLDRSLQRELEELIAKLPDLLAGRDRQTSLLHGDLWSGNYLADRDGQPVLIDPAVSHGCREAEFGMLTLFGGCPPGFYRAYQTLWPLPAGWQRRTRVYVLYHLLNHLNLFGGGYLQQCRGLVAEILRARS